MFEIFRIFTVRNFQLGDDTIGTGLVDDLQNFYDKTDSLADKAKCLELINAVNLGEAVRDNALQRPHSAMPTLGEIKYLSF